MNEPGIIPDSELDERANVFRFDKLPISSGIEPDSELFFKYRLKYLANNKDPLHDFFFNISKPLLENPEKSSGKKELEIYKILFERSTDADTKLRLTLETLPKEIIKHKEKIFCEKPLTYGSISENSPSFALSAGQTDQLLRLLLSVGASPTDLKVFFDEAHLCLTSSIELEDGTRRFDDFIKKRIGQLQLVSQTPTRKMLEKACYARISQRSRPGSRHPPGCGLLPNH